MSEHGSPQQDLAGHTSPAATLSALPRVISHRRRNYIVNGIALLIILVILVSAAFNPRFEWGTVAAYLFHPHVLRGIGMTLILTVLVSLLALLLGTALAAMKQSHIRVLKTLAAAYIWVFRSIPMLVLLLFAYNLAALYPKLFGLNTNSLITPFSAAVLALTIHEAAYVAEIIRGGMLSIPKGQHEAAEALGMGTTQRVVRIIAPQVLRVILPPLGNEIIALIKATAMVSVISLSDLLYSVQIIYSQNYETIPLLLVATIWYMVLTAVLSGLQRLLEKRFGHALSRRTKLGEPAPSAQTASEGAAS